MRGDREGYEIVGNWGECERGEGGASMVSSEGWFVGVLTSVCHSNGQIESSEGGEERGRIRNVPPPQMLRELG